MIKWIFFSAILLLIVMIGGSTRTYANEPHLKKEQMEEEHTPQYLYKVLSLEDWKKSQTQDFIKLSKDDEPFIHLAKEDQLDRITEKYWSNVPEYAVLKIEADQLPGRLVYEANPGGTNKYYHLYEGSIPLKAVLEAKIIKK